MLRAIVVFLLLANAVFFAWTKNWLAFVGLPFVNDLPVQTVPVAQLRPERIHLLTPEQLEEARWQAEQESSRSNASERPLSVAAQAAAQVAQEMQLAQAAENVAPEPAVATPVTPIEPEPVVAAVPAVCKSVTGLNEAQMAAIKPLLAALPETSWRVDESVIPGRWMVFLGGIDDELVFAAKRAQLEAKQLDFAPVRNTPQGTGFSLGRFSTEKAANQERLRLEQRGISGLRVVQERADASIYGLQLRDYSQLPSSTASQLMPILQGKSFKDCS